MQTRPSKQLRHEEAPVRGGNHLTDAVSSYPFAIFGGGWGQAMPECWPNKADIQVGHDVWIGFEATLLAGVKVGHGAVIAAESVVASDVPSSAIVAGNPARVIRFRHSEADIARLLDLAWWDWPIEKVTKHVRVIATGKVEELATLA